MSCAGWIFAGLLIISPFSNAAERKDKPRGREPRSLRTLQKMVSDVTGRAAIEFVNYGNYCGIGGSGHLLDPIDECCYNHDVCYNLSASAVCNFKKTGDIAMYSVDYNWRLADDETAVCSGNVEQCKLMMCICDSILANCLKSNINFYDASLRKPFTAADLASGAAIIDQVFG